MTILLRPYIFIIDLIYGISRKVPDKLKAWLIYLSAFALSCAGILKYSNKVLKNFAHYSDWVYPVTILAMIIISVCGISEKPGINRMRSSGPLWLGWLACFVMMFIMTFINPVKKAYFLWSICGVFIFPVIFIAWYRKENYKRICDVISEAILFTAHFYIIASLIMVPFFSGGELAYLPEYIGLAVNPNNNGMIVIGFYGAAIYLLLANRKRHPIYYLIPMGFCLGIAVISVCRAAQLSIALQSVAALIYYYRHAGKKGEDKITVGKLVAWIMAVILIACAVGVVFRQLDNMDLEVHAEDEITEEVAPELAAEPVAEAVGEPAPEPLFDKLDRLSSGRMSITRYYLTQTTFWGHGKIPGPIMEGIPASKWSFNNAVDVLYISGVIPFIGFCIWFITAIVFVIRCLFGKKHNSKAYLFTIVTFIGYFVEVMLEVTIYPMTTTLVFMAYIGLIPVACIGDGDEPEDNEAYKAKH